MRPPLPHDEELRLEALRRYEILDSAPEEAFERITSLAKRLFGVPIVLISLVDTNRQWFKSCIGLDTKTTTREVSFCAHAILRDEVMIVPDATLDPRFAQNPDVLGGPGIRFYAGAPLRTAEGAALGTLCIIDRKPRPPLSDEEQLTLSDLAAVVVDEMELRLSLRKSVEREAALNRAKAVAEQASASRAHFLSRMSHEFRTPLNAILGFAQLLEGEDLTADQKEDLRHIHDAGEQLLHLLTEALDLSRLEAGRVRMVIEDVALAPLVTAAVRAAGAPHASVDVDAGLSVLADAARLRDVVAELVGNATRHAGPEVSVLVTARRDGDVVELRVSDDGRGMTPADAEGMFAPFERGAGNAPGLGLGLAVARRTLEAMGGSITAEGAPGTGTTMVVSLPAGTAPAPEDRQSVRLLYVDDDPSNLHLVEKILAGRPGMQLHLATTGAEGIAAATEELPDLVLLDLHLPDLPGTDVVKALRSDARTASTPIVVVTVEDDPAVIAAVRDLGVSAVVTKPFDSRLLVDAIESHLSEKAVR